MGSEEPKQQPDIIIFMWVHNLKIINHYISSHYLRYPNFSITGCTTLSMPLSIMPIIFISCHLLICLGYLWYLSSTGPSSRIVLSVCQEYKLALVFELNTLISIRWMLSYSLRHCTMTSITPDYSPIFLSFGAIFSKNAIIVCLI
jgi:hypothetical protein